MKIRITNNVELPTLKAWIPTALVLAIGLFAVHPVHAQKSASDQSRTMMEPTYNLKFMLGLGGEAEFEGDIDDIPPIIPPLVVRQLLDGLNIDQDLEPTIGAGFEFDYPLHKYFLLGFMFSFLSWNTDPSSDSDVDRSFLLDFSIVPKGRYPFEGSPFAIYVCLPIGFSMDLIDDESLEIAFGQTGVIDADVGVGMNLSVLFGAQVNLESYFGLMMELGYSYHYVSHEGEVSVVGTDLEGETEVEMDQFALNLGFYFM